MDLCSVYFAPGSSLAVSMWSCNFLVLVSLGTSIIMKGRWVFLLGGVALNTMFSEVTYLQTCCSSSYFSHVIQSICPSQSSLLWYNILIYYMITLLPLHPLLVSSLLWKQLLGKGGKARDGLRQCCGKWFCFPAGPILDVQMNLVNTSSVAYWTITCSGHCGQCNVYKPSLSFNLL